MPRYGVVNISAVVGETHKELVELDSSELCEKLHLLSESYLAEPAITPDVEDYGFPPDAKERLM